MKLKNKRTGKIGYLYERSLMQDLIIVYDVKGIVGKYNSLAELNEEWEDYREEPKKYWFIDAFGNIVQNEITKHRGDEYIDMTNAYEDQKQIGNYFETKEEAEKAVEKLKAWKRLRDKGFRFRWIDMEDGHIKYGIFLENEQKFIHNDEDDLLLLFGGEE